MPGVCLTFTDLQVLIKEASEFVIPIYPSAKGIQHQGQVSRMQVPPPLKLLGIFWILKLRSGTHPSMMHRAILFNAILLILLQGFCVLFYQFGSAIFFRKEAAEGNSALLNVFDR